MLFREIEIFLIGFIYIFLSPQTQIDNLKLKQQYNTNVYNKELTLSLTSNSYLSRTNDLNVFVVQNKFVSQLVVIVKAPVCFSENITWPELEES